jgi:hypothetical protein
LQTIAMSTSKPQWELSPIFSLLPSLALSGGRVPLHLNVLARLCERSEAIQRYRLDCFVAYASRNDEDALKPMSHKGPSNQD